jgi:hypothetical protein
MQRFGSGVGAMATFSAFQRAEHVSDVGSDTPWRTPLKTSGRARTCFAVFAVAFALVPACGGESTNSAREISNAADGGQRDATTRDSVADALQADSAPRACSAALVTYDIGSFAEATYICKSADDCTICVQTVDETGMPLQWFDIPIPRCVCPSPTVRVPPDASSD